MILRLGIPSKGRLMEATFDWFRARGVDMASTGDEREYAASSDIEGLTVVLLSAGEIPRELAAGRIHLGVTGTDVVREKLAGWDTRVTEILPLGFGHADLVMAVPGFWVDVETLGDLDAVAAAFRRAHGHRLRIATKYHRLVREFLRREGVGDYQLVDSQGATEGTVRNLTAEAVADITSTGDTLRANHLRPLEGAVILHSEATLFRSDVAPWDSGAEPALDALLTRLDIKR